MPLTPGREWHHAVKPPARCQVGDSRGALEAKQMARQIKHSSDLPDLENYLTNVVEDRSHRQCNGSYRQQSDDVKGALELLVRQISLRARRSVLLVS
jgi:hypothetical protein